MDLIMLYSGYVIILTLQSVTITCVVHHTNRNPGGQYKCEESSCRFPVVPSLEEYHISLLVRNPLGQQSAPYSFNISDRGVNPILRLSSRYSSA